MKLTYTGKRQYVAHDFYHNRYVFKKENDFTCDVEEKEAQIALLTTGEYEPAPEIKTRIIHRKAPKK